MATLTSTNPYTKEINATFETISNDELTSKLNQAAEAYKTRKNVSHEDKKNLFLRLAQVIEDDIEGHARLETIEMGRLFGVAVAWMKWTVALIRRFANNFSDILANEKVTDEWLTGHIQYDPLGVIYGIAPRNFPYNQLLRAAVPNLLAGNTVVYKHASNVPLCAQAIETCFQVAWFPAGVYTNLFITPDQSELVIAHPAVQWVNLTWSETAWSAVGALAGKYCKRSVLELWGNDAFLLLDHKDTQKMAAEAVQCRISNGGQRCNASKRFIILEPYYETFVAEMGKYMEHLHVWDPLDKETQLPPLSSQKLLEEIEAQVQASVQQGARLVTGGTTIDKEKNLYAGTVLADMQPGMTAREQEVFGPVASICKATSVEEAIMLANQSDFWLSAVVYGDDHNQCKHVAAQLEWGMIFINQPAGSKASLPFWWVKKSGYGKENGADGLKSFTNRKVVIY